MRKPTNNILSILGKPEPLSQAEMEENLAKVAEFLFEEREREEHDRGGGARGGAATHRYLV